MEYQIYGTVMQTLDITLNKGEAIYTEAGGMAWMKGNIQMDTGTRGGLLGGLGRMMSGESLFMTTYSAGSDGDLITFAPEAPGKILDLKLAAGEVIICQRDSFMCAEDSVELAMHFRKKLGAGLFGGEGFILQKVTGPGTAFLEIPGELREYNLAQGESMRIDPGHLAAFEESVQYDITQVKGIKNMLLAGEGVFLARVTGPGRVWLQSMPLSNLAAKLIPYLPSK